MQLKLLLAEKFGDNNEQVGLAVLDLLGLFPSGIFCFITGCLLHNVMKHWVVSEKNKNLKTVQFRKPEKSYS